MSSCQELSLKRNTKRNLSNGLTKTYASSNTSVIPWRKYSRCDVMLSGPESVAPGDRTPYERIDPDHEPIFLLAFGSNISKFSRVSQNGARHRTFGRRDSGMITVQIGENESFDKALKRFKRKCLQSGLMRTLRETTHYTKPSEKKKADRLRAIRKQRQMQAESGD